MEGLKFLLVGRVDSSGKPMDEHVVECEVGEPVGGHSESDPEQWAVQVHTKVDECDRRNREEHGKEVVLLEATPFREVVRFMQGPQEAVHDVLVCQIRHSFHACEGSQEQEDVQEHRKRINVPSG